MGQCFLWRVEPGWALLDYLCVSKARRSSGLGAALLAMAQAAAPDTVIFAEAEAPEDAPDPEAAIRRLAFYDRCGAKKAGYDTELFGVHYQTLYFSADEIDDGTLLRQHRLVYQRSIPKRVYDAYVRIPWNGLPGKKVPWTE